MDEIAKQLNEAIDERIDTRADFHAKCAALGAAIRAKLDLKIAQLPIADNKRKHVTETTETTALLMLSAVVEGAKKQVADILWEKTGVHVSTHKVPDHVCAPFLDKVGKSALAALD